MPESSKSFAAPQPDDQRLDRTRNPRNGALVTIVIVCWLVGFVASPADPISMLIAGVFFTLLGVGCYLWGFRHGRGCQRN